MRLESIQSLRALAVLVVFFFHLQFIESEMIAALGSQESTLIGGLFQNGYAGVDLFFVISGFIIVYVTGRADAGRYPLGSFLFARAARIYLPWWFFASLLGVYFWITYGAPWDVEELSRDGRSPAWHLIASFLLLPQDDFPLLGVGWTLVHEMHFYFIFALLLLLPYRLRVAGLIAWAGIVILGGLAGLAQPFAKDLIALFFSPLTLEFLMGGMAALLVVNGFRWRPGLLAIGGLLGFGLAMVFHELQAEWTLVWGRVLWFGVPGAVLTYGLVSLDLEGRYRAPPGATALGDWSYGLYLCHMLVLSAVHRLHFIAADMGEAHLGVPSWAANLLRVGSPGWADNLTLLITGSVATLITAWLTYRFFEQPMLHHASRLRRHLFEGRDGSLEPQPIRAMVW
ncbi:MAG: acyltransferase [Pseudomonadota bacterium]